MLCFTQYVNHNKPVLASLPSPPKNSELILIFHYIFSPHFAELNLKIWAPGHESCLRSKWDIKLSKNPFEKNLYSFAASFFLTSQASIITTTSVSLLLCWLLDLWLYHLCCELSVCWLIRIKELAELKGTLSNVGWQSVRIHHAVKSSVFAIINYFPWSQTFISKKALCSLLEGQNKVSFLIFMTNKQHLK